MNLIGLLVVLLGITCAWAPASWAQSPHPVLRGIVITPSGEGRAYFQNATTGVLGAYLVGDVIDGSRIEQIREDVVVLRRGDEVVRIQMGSAPDSETSAVAAVPADVSSEPSPAPAAMPVSRPDPTGGPAIADGQPDLDRLGVPPQALSRAVEEAVPAEEPDSDNPKD